MCEWMVQTKNCSNLNDCIHTLLVKNDIKFKLFVSTCSLIRAYPECWCCCYWKTWDSYHITKCLIESNPIHRPQIISHRLNYHFSFNTKHSHMIRYLSPSIPSNEWSATMAAGAFHNSIARLVTHDYSLCIWCRMLKQNVPITFHPMTFCCGLCFVFLLFCCFVFMFPIVLRLVLLFICSTLSPVAYFMNKRTYSLHTFTTQTLTNYTKIDSIFHSCLSQSFVIKDKIQSIYSTHSIC